MFGPNTRKRLYILTDVESTGTDCINDHVFDIAIIVTDGNEDKQEFSSLIRISDYLIEKTQRELSHVVHIDKTKVQNAKTNKEVMQEVLELLEKYDEDYDLKLVGHNVAFDYGMITFSMKRVSEEYKNRFLKIFPKHKTLDTKALTKLYYGDLPSYSLTNICKHLNIAVNMIDQRDKEKHSALLDTKILYELFKKLKAQSQFSQL